ncbi:hypothetical protein AVEN_87181-1 [Araneus ventricosus]|uniref:DUF7041 domain-containing protein n=1 Tax=Araneus ventricosus TaxID=182803 RepID=A0A4Y2WYT5_ARAVE|nr:hypothetical protein AVEN_87181-1 [Araneus ventricosus]
MTEISAVRIPPYNFGDPHLWFAMCDRTFGLGAVTDSVTKFNYIVSNLPPEAAAIVRDVIINPDTVMVSDKDTIDPKIGRATAARDTEIFRRGIQIGMPSDA